MRIELREDGGHWIQAIQRCLTIRTAEPWLILAERSGSLIIGDTFMKIVRKGESRNTVAKVQGSTVNVQHVTLNKPTKQHFQLNWTFDFAGVPQEKLLELAAKGLVIASRPKFKAEKDSKKLEAWENKTFKVSDFLSRERKRVSATDKLQALISSGSVGKDEVLAMLQKAGFLK